MKQSGKDRELIAAEKARQDSEMHRLYAAFLENNELGIDEAEELLKNVKNSKNVKKSQSCSCSKNICVGEKCSQNIMVSVGEKQNAVDDRKKVCHGTRKMRIPCPREKTVS